LKYFWQWEKALDEIEKGTLRKGISAYRNQGHQYPAIIGCKWGGDDKFVRHFLPTINGHEPKDEIDIKELLQRYFEFVVNVWLSLHLETLRKNSRVTSRFPSLCLTPLSENFRRNYSRSLNCQLR
jgi:hypothetical protein